MGRMSDKDLSRNGKRLRLRFRGRRPGVLAGFLAVAMGGLSMLAGPSAHAAVTGPGLYDNVRYANGTWAGWEPPTQPPGATAGEDFLVGNAYVGNDVHVDVVDSSGQLLDNVRYANGTWAGWHAPPQPPGTIYLARESSDGGNLFIVAYTSSGLYVVERSGPTGQWSNWATTPLPGNGVVGDLAVAVTYGTVSEQVQIAITLAGGTLEHQIYNVDFGSWTGWAKPVQIPGGDFSIAAAGTSNGNANFMAVSLKGIVYFNIRYANGTWQGWQSPSQPPNLTAATTTGLATVSAAADDAGNTQFILTEATDVNNDEDLAYHDIRYANGSWQGWNQLNLGCPWAAPIITAPTFIAATTIQDAHVDEMCVQNGS
jgi:hypothetical protein